MRSFLGQPAESCRAKFLQQLVSSATSPIAEGYSRALNPCSCSRAGRIRHVSFLITPKRLCSIIGIESILLGFDILLLHGQLANDGTSSPE